MESSISTISNTAVFNTVLSLVILLTPVVLGTSVGALVGNDVAKASYASVKKPTWSPPPYVFGIVWTVLYLLMGVASWRIYYAGTNASKNSVTVTVKAVNWALTLFAAQLLLNLVWSPVYFSLGMRRLALALLLVLDVLVLATIVAFARVDVAAAWLLAPYAAWLGVATALNASVVWLNP